VNEFSGSGGADPQTSTKQAPTSSPPAPLHTDWSYEATVREIEQIMTQIELGELDLADVFDQFAAAVAYLHQCETFLAQRQQQMDLLIETLTDDLD